ncbi:MAG: hypothetical protein IJU01_02600 [Lachnospiraceae bacterium]|nr:hypothetical protein [Lachnospiraceae bacterium]
MKKFIKTTTLVLAVALFASLFTACGESYGPKAGDVDYKTVVAATYGDEEIMLDEVNYFLRKEQWSFESYAWSLYSQYGYDNPWKVPYSEYKTMEEYIKEYVMTQVYQTRVLIDHAEDYGLRYEDLDEEAIKTAAQTAFDDLDEAFFEYAPVTVEDITEWYRQNALANLVYNVVKDAAEVDATAEETEVYTVEYVEVEDEEEAKKIAEELAAAEDLDAWAEENETLSLSHSHILKVLGEDEEETAIYKATSSLKTGETATYQDGEKWYAAIVTNDNDTEETANKKEEVLEQKRDEAFLEVYEGWVKQAPSFKTTDAWDNLIVTDGTTIIPPTEEAEEEDNGEDGIDIESEGDEDESETEEAPQEESTDPNEATGD